MGCIVPILVLLIIYSVCAPVIMTGVLLFICISAMGMMFSRGRRD